jgi:hypothetical protein
MFKKRLSQLLFAAGLIAVAMATSAFAHVNHSASQTGLAVGGSVVVTNKILSPVVKHKGLESLGDVSPGVKGTNIKPNASLARAGSMAMQESCQEYRNCDTSRCLRGGNCICTRGTHASNCSGGGDCPNHSGILCLWD